MANYVKVRNGMTSADEADINSYVTNFLVQTGVVFNATTDFLVAQQGTPAMGVTVSAGTGFVPNSSYAVNATTARAWEVHSDASQNVTITANASGSTRVDLIALKVDTAAVPDANASNVMTVVAVAGTPGAGTPATPSNHEVLATVSVASGATSITNANITDKRKRAYLDASKTALANDASFYGLGTDGITRYAMFKLNSSNKLEFDATQSANVITAPMIATNAMSLGLATSTTAFTTTSTSSIQVTGLSLTVTIPSGGRRVKAVATSYYAGIANVNGVVGFVSLWDGTVNVGTNLQTQQIGGFGASAVGLVPTTLLYYHTPSAGSKTYNVGVNALSSGTMNFASAATAPSQLAVEIV